MRAEATGGMGTARDHPLPSLPVSPATDVGKRHDVVGIGNAIVDVITHASEDFLDEHGLTKGAMTLIDGDRAIALYEAMGAGRESSGGSAANTVAGVASFGGRAAFIGKVRDDQLGEIFGHDIRAAGVDFDVLPGEDGPPTARCLILVTPDAQRTMNTFLGISSLLAPDDVDEDRVATAGEVYCEGYIWDVPQAKEAIVKAFDRAIAAGGKVSFALSDGFCVDRHRAEFHDLLTSRIDILFANEDEICSLYEVDDFDAAAALVQGSCAVAVLTRSGKGSLLVTPDEMIEVAAEPVEEVVDTTGAGDLYAAGFLRGYTDGRPLEECGRLGAAAASEVITHLGARPEQPPAELLD
jgi:sugar/nucleoside kinase (ribokinase family)